MNLPPLAAILGAALLLQGCLGPASGQRKKIPPGAFSLARILDFKGPFPKTVHGKFLVNATVDNRAVLHDLEKDRDKVRILVEFRDGHETPPQGTEWIVPPEAGLEVLEISRSSDGEVNISTRAPSPQ